MNQIKFPDDFWQKKKKKIKIYNESWYALDHKNPKSNPET